MPAFISLPRDPRCHWPRHYISFADHARLSGCCRRRYGGGDLGLKGGTYWRDQNLGTSLYGVFADEARVDRPAYAVRQGFTPYAGLKLSYPIIGDLQAVLAAEAEYLNDRTAASPIIARPIVPSAMFGLFYSFGVQ